LWLIDRLGERVAAVLVLASAGCVASFSVFLTTLTSGLASGVEPFMVLGGGVGVAVIWMLVGWTLLQFEWLHFNSPPVCIGIERFVVALAPLVVPTVLVWLGLRADLFDANAAPLLLVVLMCVTHALYGAPQSSIFKRPRRDEHDTGDIASTVVDTLVQHVSMVVLPFLFYLALFSGVYDDDLPLHWSQSLCLPALATFYLGAQEVAGGRTLWFLRRAWRRNVAILAANGAAVVLIWCFHYRVLIRGYGHLIFLHGMSAHFVSLGLIASAALGAALLLGLVPVDRRQQQLMSSALFGVGAGVCAVLTAMPWLIKLLPTGAVILAIDFRYSLRMRSYLAAVALAAPCVWWLSFRTLWFMRVVCEEMATCVGEQHLLSFALTTAFVLSSVLLGAVLTRSRSTSIVFGLHAAVYTWVERLFVDAANIALTDRLYTPWLTAFGAVVGIALVQYLLRTQRITRLGAWLGVSLHAARIALWLDGSWWTLAASLAFTAAVTRLWAFRDVPASLAGGDSADDLWTARSTLLHAGSIALACLAVRPTLLVPLIEDLGDFADEPYWTVSMGAALLIWSLAVWPLTQRRAPATAAAMRSSLLVAALGSLLLLGSEPYTGALASLSNSAAGGGIAHTPLAIVLFFVLLLASPTSVVGLSRSAARRYGYAALVGSVGAVVINEGYMPPTSETGNALAAYALFALMCVWLALLFAALFATVWPLPQRGGLQRGELFFGSHALVTVALWYLVTSAYSVHGHAPPRGDDRIDSAFVVLVGTLVFTSVLFAALVRLVCNGGNIGTSGSTAVQAQIDPRKSIVAVSAARRASSTVDDDERRLVIGSNVAVVLAYALAIWINVVSLEGTSYSAFALAPLLLLVGDDGVWWCARSRWAAPLFGVTVAMLLFALVTIAAHTTDQWAERDATALSVLYFVGRHLMMLACSVPSLVSLGKWVSATSTSDDATNVVFAVPLNFLPLFFARVRAIQLLAGACVLGGMAVFVLAETASVRWKRFLQ
jgi:hypothetical protein